MFTARYCVSVLVVLFWQVFPALPAGAATLNYIYIDSSVDEAAGGHAAVRLGDTVFHFQYYGDGLFLMEKDQWPDFYQQYSNLQNRTLSVGSVPVSDAVFHRLKTRFLTRFLIQQKRMAYKRQLESAVSCLDRSLAGDFSIPMRGLGFFSGTVSGNPQENDLKARVEDALGPDFLKEKTEALRLKINKQIQAAPPAAPSQQQMTFYRHESSPVLPGLELNTTRMLLQAVLVVLNELPLKNEHLITAGDQSTPLDAEKIAVLNSYREFFFSSILSLLQSQRLDSGESLLLQVARYSVLSHSINSGQLFTLYPFSDDHELIPVSDLRSTVVYDKREMDTDPAEATSYFNHLQRAWQHQALAAQNYLFEAEEISELTYNLLESAQGRAWEISRAARDDDVLVMEEGHLIPCRIGYVRDPFKTSRERVLLQGERLAVIRNSFISQLHELYSYDLFQQNCVTELFSTINSAFASEEMIRQELGGYMAPESGLTFVPFKSFDIFQRNFPVAQVSILPSYRKRYLQRQENSASLLGYARESTTLTSSIYHPWKQDSVFLFFTDDITLLRPVYGCINLLYGALGSVTGILALPVDQGSLLKRAGKGVVFSVPELFFVNIRKGTFPSTMELQ